MKVSALIIAPQDTPQNKIDWPSSTATTNKAIFDRKEVDYETTLIARPQSRHRLAADARSHMAGISRDGQDSAAPLGLVRSVPSKPDTSDGKASGKAANISEDRERTLNA